MTTVNIEDLQTDLTHFIDQAAAGESLLITRAGKPLVTVQAARPQPTAEERAATAKKRIGLLDGMYPPSEDIKGPWREEIEEMFGLND